MRQEGFFSRKETESRSRPDGKVHSCVSCGLYKNTESPKMKPSGNFKKRILNIGGMVTKAEDQKGEHWQGPAKRILERTYFDLGIDLQEDCLNIHAINCYPGNNNINQTYQLTCCRTIVLRIIAEYKPNVIILLGNEAINSLIGHRWQKNLGDIGKWRGYQIPDVDFEAWVCPVFDPTFVVDGNKEAETIWKSDLAEAFSKINIPPTPYVEPKIDYIEDLSPLNDIDDTIIAFDYETTGIKPHAKGHRIVCASVATGPNHCYTFMIPPTRSARQPFINLLARPTVLKMAHNMKFEENWSVVRLRQAVIGWHMDSMLFAHIADNGIGVTNLKFQSYVQFGIVNYDSEVSPYLHTTEKGGNVINRIMDLIAQPNGSRKLLTYCALDSIYEYRLANLQKDAL